MQLTAKALFPIRHKKSLGEAIAFLEEIYIVNTNSIENRTTFAEFTTLLVKTMKSLIAAAVCAFCTYMVSPAVLYLIDDSHLEPIVPWVLPGTSPGSTNMQHYLINQIFNVFVVFWSIDFYLLFAMFFTFLLLHVALLSNVMTNKLHGIDRMLLDKTMSNYAIKMRLQNIILMHNELGSWV